MPEIASPGEYELEIDPERIIDRAIVAKISQVARRYFENDEDIMVSARSLLHTPDYEVATMIS